MTGKALALGAQARSTSPQDVGARGRTVDRMGSSGRSRWSRWRLTLKVLVTFSRKPRMLGYYSPERWERTNNPEDLAGEISFNPDSFESRTAQDVLSTLAHEMAHAWQHHFGKPSRAGYHNVEWAEKMA